MKSNQQTFTLKSLPGRSAMINGEEWLYFSGTNYLGVVQDEAFIALVQEGIVNYGVHFGGSRLSNTQIDIYKEAEYLLARQVGLESALTVTSGTLAGRLVLSVFGDDFIKCHAPGAHPAIQENHRYAAFYEQWLENLLDLCAERPGHPLVLLLNSIDPLKAKESNLEWLQLLPNDLPIYLVIDDSHAFGILGETGEGIAAQLELPDQVSLIIISSLGKAFGVPGGAIMGPKNIVELIWKTPMFGGASPISPAFLNAFVKGQTIYAQKRALLKQNIRHFLKHLPNRQAFKYIDDFPVFYTKFNHLTTYLTRNQILISSFPYPSPEDDPITRIILNGSHTTADIDTLLGNLVPFFS